MGGSLSKARVFAENISYSPDYVADEIRKAHSEIHKLVAQGEFSDCTEIGEEACATLYRDDETVRDGFEALHGLVRDKVLKAHNMIEATHDSGEFSKDDACDIVRFFSECRIITEQLAKIECGTVSGDYLACEQDGLETLAIMVSDESIDQLDFAINIKRIDNPHWDEADRTKILNNVFLSKGGDQYAGENVGFEPGEVVLDC